MTLLHKAASERTPPFPRTQLSHGFRDGYAERVVAVHDCNTDLNLCNLSVKVPRHEALSQEFHAVHLGFGTAPAVVLAPVSPDRAAQVFGCPQGLVACDGSRCDWLPGFGILSGRDDSHGTPVGDGVVTVAGVVGTVSRDAPDLFITGIWLSRSGSTGASPMWLPVISTARTSSVSSSIPRWIFRQTRRLGPPCLRACHSPSAL